MRLLAVDTALDACSVAVLADGYALDACVEPMARGHQERLAPMVAEAMGRAGLAFAELDRIAVTVGPGSFTGLRVGLAFAKSAALALGVPCIGIGTLEALAASCGAEAAPLAAAVLDARREHVYLQLFRFGEALDAPANLSIEMAQARLAAHGADAGTLLVGSGAPLLRPGVGGEAGIDPVAVARLAAVRDPPLHRPDPVYLRAPDARTIAERAAATAAAAAV